VLLNLKLPVLIHDWRSVGFIKQCSFCGLRSKMSSDKICIDDQEMLQSASDGGVRWVD